MPVDRELIQIEAHEDANSVKDRLSFMRGRRVLLVWPEEGKALTRKLDLVLIQREAMRRQIRLAVVTHDPQVMKHARELNISTFETIGASERGRWKRGRSKVFTNRWQRPKDSPEPEALIDVASRVRSAQNRLSGVWTWLTRLLVLAVLVAVIGAVVFLVLPTAVVSLQPAEERISVSVDITVSTDPTVNNIDSVNGVIPSLEVVVEVPEQTLDTETTGTQDTGTTRAIGTVVFINTTAGPIEIPQGTVVATTDGSNLSFQTTADATLPAGEGSEVDVPIEAMPNSSGDAGNVGENLINSVIGPLADRVIVLNREPTTGGQQRIVNVVTQEDIDRLERLMYQQIQQRAYEEMPNFPGLTQRHVIIDETVHIEDPRDDWVSRSAEPGTQADTVSMQMQARITALAYDEQQAENLVYLRLSERVPRGRVIQPETVTYEAGPATIQGDSIRFTMTGTSVVAGRVDENLLRDELAGRTIEEALAYINEQVDVAPGSTARITVSPDLFGRLPLWGERIRFEIQSPSAVESPAPEATPEATEAGLDS